jgi:hypothetical protein
VALLAAEDALKSAESQCRIDLDVQRALNEGFGAARAELAAAREIDSVAIAYSVATGAAELPKDAGLAAERRHERIKNALVHHVEIVIRRNETKYFEVLASLLDHRADLVDVAVRMRREYVAKLSAPILQFEQTAGMSLEKGSITAVLVALAAEQREAARQIRAGQRHRLGDIPVDTKFRRTLNLL